MSRTLGEETNVNTMTKHSKSREWQIAAGGGIFLLVLLYFLAPPFLYMGATRLDSATSVDPFPVYKALTFPIDLLVRRSGTVFEFYRNYYQFVGAT